MFKRLNMPAFGEATEWLNAEPLGPAELRGPALYFVDADGLIRDQHFGEPGAEAYVFTFG